MNWPPEVWDMSKVFAVRRCVAQVRISLLAVTQSDGRALEFTREALVSELTECVRASAVVDIDPRDVTFHQLNEAGLPSLDSEVLVRARWMPSEAVVSFSGGPSDGVLTQVEDRLIWGPIRVPYLRRRHWELTPEDTAPADADISGVVLYEMSGWNSTSRHWIYQFKRYE